MSIFTRTVACTLHNRSKHALMLDNAELIRGDFTSAPPAMIEAGASGEWATTSAGFMTGTEGLIAYTLDRPDARFIVSWSNPFIGDNTFTQRYEPGATAPQDEHIVPFDPMFPEGAPVTGYDRRIERVEQLRDDEEVSVTFRLDLEEHDADDNADDDADDDDDAETASPKSDETKVVQNHGGNYSTVRDGSDGFRKTVYVGLNVNMGTMEVNALYRLTAGCPTVPGKKLMPAVTALKLGDVFEWRTKTTEFSPLDAPAEEFWGRLKKLPPHAQKLLADDEKAGPPLFVNTDKKRVSRDLHSPSRRGVRASIAELFAAVEAEVTTLTTSVTVRMHPMARLVLSGHHWPSGDYFPDTPIDRRDYTDNSLCVGRGVIWGDQSAPPQEFTRVLDFFRDLGVIARAFPVAAAQVEDLHLSACGTGIHAGTPFNVKANSDGTLPLDPWRILDDPKLLRIFPNLRTVWACQGISGLCSQQLEEWAKALKHAQPEHELVRVAREMSKPAPNGIIRERRPEPLRVIVWTRQGDAMQPNP